MNYIITNENACFYECGYSCDNAILLIFGDERVFITDGRYETSAKATLVDTKLLISRDLLGTAIDEINASGIKTLIYDALMLSAYEFIQLSAKTSVSLKDEKNFSQKKRIIKSDKEIQYIQKSISLNANAFDKFATFVSQNQNLSEKELYFNAQNILSHRGQYDLSFDPITAISSNSALPHALPTDICSIRDDVLLFDAGIKYHGYCSDRTRTASISDGMNFDKYNQKFKDPFEQKVYDTVLQAQENAVKIAKVGARASDIDKAARYTIDKAGFGKYFIHSTGHGVGLDIHELPVISAKSNDIIEPNMAFTIEPGIYIPGKFGVRIEDIVIS